jgi:hypothetical protein
MLYRGPTASLSETALTILVAAVAIVPLVTLWGGVYAMTQQIASVL